MILSITDETSQRAVYGSVHLTGSRPVKAMVTLATLALAIGELTARIPRVVALRAI
jgi:hypothetical protein